MSGGVAREPVVSATAATGVSRTHSASLVQRAFRPSPLEETPGPSRLDAFARLRGWFTLGAINLDIGIYLSFRGSAHFDARALAWFVWLNVPLLAISTLLCFFVLRRKSRWFV